MKINRPGDKAKPETHKANEWPVGSVIQTSDGTTILLVCVDGKVVDLVRNYVGFASGYVFDYILCPNAVLELNQ